MSTRIQVGVVPYLNAKPLIAGYEAYESVADFHFIEPSQLAAPLARGDLDVALISVVEYLRGTYDILPRAAIISRGAVNSVLLTGSCPIEQAETVNLDPASLTSCTLAALWYRERLGRTPRFSRFPLDSHEAMACDAQLAIGDAALARMGTAPFQVDLGSAWETWIGHPFVYAAWIARRGVDLGAVGRFLIEAPFVNQPRLLSIASEASERMGLPDALCVEYLTHSLQFRLDEDALTGLQSFLDLAAEHHDWLSTVVTDLPPLGVSAPVPIHFGAPTFHRCSAKS